MASKNIRILIEFGVTVAKVIWITFVSLVKMVWYSEKDVSQEVVLVTGGGSGIGRLMALKFAKLGASVVLWDINKGGNLAVQKEIQSGGGKAYAFQVDLSQREEIREVASKVCTLDGGGGRGKILDVLSEPGKDRLGYYLGASCLTVGCHCTATNPHNCLKFQLSRLWLSVARFPRLWLPRLWLPRLWLPRLWLPRLWLPRLWLPRLWLPRLWLPRLWLPRLWLPRLWLPRLWLPRLWLPRLWLPRLWLPRLWLPRLWLPRLWLPRLWLPRLWLPRLC